MKNNKIKALTLEIDKGVWEMFKNLVPRSINLNESVVLLIEDFIINPRYTIMKKRVLRNGIHSIEKLMKKENGN